MDQCTTPSSRNRWAVQGSTSFSFFAWANVTAGYKWGRALPEFCMDEVWPDGGVDGKYPDDSARCEAPFSSPNDDTAHLSYMYVLKRNNHANCYHIASL
jgi:hypothetical protein